MWVQIPMVIESHTLTKTHLQLGFGFAELLFFLILEGGGGGILVSCQQKCLVESVQAFICFMFPAGGVFFLQRR